MKSNDSIEDKIFDYISDFVKDKKEALGLSGMIVYLTHKYGKKCAAIGFVSGVLFTILILKWLS